jgi:hypothetical protein
VDTAFLSPIPLPSYFLLLSSSSSSLSFYPVVSLQSSSVVHLFRFKPLVKAKKDSLVDSFHCLK